MKNPFMLRVKINSKYTPLFDAYCRGQGILFKICGGGFRRFTVDNITGVRYDEYNIWPLDKEFMRLQCFELPFDDEPPF